VSPEDTAYLDGLKQSIRTKDESRTSGENAFTLVLALGLGILALVLAVVVLQRAAWVKVGIDQGPRPTIVRHAGPIGQV
jgi:hypothetical protein